MTASRGERRGLLGTSADEPTRPCGCTGPAAGWPRPALRRRPGDGPGGFCHERAVRLARLTGCAAPCRRRRVAARRCRAGDPHPATRRSRCVNEPGPRDPATAPPPPTVVGSHPRRGRHAPRPGPPGCRSRSWPGRSSWPGTTEPVRPPAWCAGCTSAAPSGRREHHLQHPDPRRQRIGAAGRPRPRLPGVHRHRPGGWHRRPDPGRGHPPSRRSCRPARPATRG